MNEHNTCSITVTVLYRMKKSELNITKIQPKVSCSTYGSIFSLHYNSILSYKSIKHSQSGLVTFCYKDRHLSSPEFMICDLNEHILVSTWSAHHDNICTVCAADYCSTIDHLNQLSCSSQPLCIVYSDLFFLVLLETVFSSFLLCASRI